LQTQRKQLNSKGIADIKQENKTENFIKRVKQLLAFNQSCSAWKKLYF